MPRSTWSVALAAVAVARPAPLKLQLHTRRPEAGRAGASLRAIGVRGGSRDATAIAIRGGSYDESYDDDWSGEGYAGGDAYDYGGAPPVDAPTWTFFRALVCHRLAAINHGVFARSLQGNAASEKAAMMGPAFAYIVDLGVKGMTELRDGRASRL